VRGDCGEGPIKDNDDYRSGRGIAMVQKFTRDPKDDFLTTPSSLPFMFI